MMPDLIDMMQGSHVHQQNWRNGDPETSRLAGVTAHKFRGIDQEQIFQAMMLAGKPLAGEEISDLLGWNDHVRVARRMSELRDAALIERDPGPKHTNKSGRLADRYRVKSRQSVAA